MTVTLIQNVQSYLANHQITQQVGKFAGYAWTHIQNFPTYAQDWRVAYSSLIIANCIIFQVAKTATRGLQYVCPRSEDPSSIRNKAIELLSMGLGCGIVIGGVTLFVTKAQLPLSPYMSAVVSIATVVLCHLLETSLK